MKDIFGVWLCPDPFPPLPVGTYSSVAPAPDTRSLNRRSFEDDREAERGRLAQNR